MGIQVKELGMGVKLIKRDKFQDYRGYYSEIYSTRTLLENGIVFNCVQDNEAFSAKKGTVRGIHFQNNPFSQAKMLRCVKGKVFDVAVDLRKESKTYGKYVSVILEEGDDTFIYIPKGFGHLAVSLVDNTTINYKVDNLYDKHSERSIRYDDKSIGIVFPNDLENFIVSEKDKNASEFSKCDIDL